MHSITLEFDTLFDMQATIEKLNAPGILPSRLIPSLHMAPTRAPAIAHEDRPDVGAPPAPMVPLAAVHAAVSSAQGAAIFGGAAEPVVPPVARTPPSAAIAPTAAPSPAGAVERDANGMPWDARVHSASADGSKTRNADNTWRSKRNVDKDLKARVEAELSGAPAPLVPLAAPAAPAAPPAPAAVSPVAPAVETFGAYMARIGALFNTQPRKAMPSMTSALAPFGLTAIGQLAGKPELIPMVDAAFQQLMAA